MPRPAINTEAILQRCLLACSVHDHRQDALLPVRTGLVPSGAQAAPCAITKVQPGQRRGQPATRSCNCEGKCKCGVRRTFRVHGGVSRAVAYARCALRVHCGASESQHPAARSSSTKETTSQGPLQGSMRTAHCTLHTCAQIPPTHPCVRRHICTASSRRSETS